MAMATTINGRGNDGREAGVGVFGQPALLAVAAGVVAVGVIARRGELVRGGARLLAVELAGAVIGAVVRRSADRPAAGAAAPPPMAIDAMAGWLAETLVGVAIERLEPSLEQAIVRRSAG